MCETLNIKGNYAREKQNKIMTTQITTAARKIAKLHNNRVKTGFGGNGFIVVGADGSGGAWYSDNSRPALGDAIKVYIRWERMTAAQA